MFALANGAPQAVTLYTSLPLRSERLAAGRELGAVYQRECIASWRRLGFDVVSLNACAEIEALLLLDYEVTFKEVATSPPRIGDFLAVIKEKPAAVAAIINADCMMVANDAAISLVVQSAKQGLVLVERLNIGADDVKATGVSCCGFDLLLFAKQVLDGLESDREISIGTPWWDYWFPISYHLAGGQLFSAPAPLLLHLDHPHSWSWENWLTHGQQMHDSLARYRGSGSSLPFVKHDQTDELSNSEAGDFAIATLSMAENCASCHPSGRSIGVVVVLLLGGHRFCGQAGKGGRTRFRGGQAPPRGGRTPPRGGRTPPKGSKGLTFLEGDATASRRRESALSDQVANKVEFIPQAVDARLKPIVRSVRVKCHFKHADAQLAHR